MIGLPEQKVNEGKLDRKTKTGFCKYPVKTSVSGNVKSDREKDLLKQITHWYLDGVFGVLHRGVCGKEELEFLVREYMATGQSLFDLTEYTP